MAHSEKGKKIQIPTVRKRSLRQGNVFTYVCHSVHREDRGWLPNMHHMSHDQGWGVGVCIQGGGGLHASKGGGWSASKGEGGQTGTRKVGGTHPTGMLPCYDKDHCPLYGSHFSGLIKLPDFSVLFFFTFPLIIII